MDQIAFLSSFCPVIQINRLLATCYSQLSTFRSEPNTALKRSTSPQNDDPRYTQSIPLPHRSTAYRRDLAGQVNHPLFLSKYRYLGKTGGELTPGWVRKSIMTRVSKPTVFIRVSRYFRVQNVKMRAHLTSDINPWTVCKGVV